MFLPIHATMLDLVWAASVFSDSDREVATAVAFLVNSGTVVLRGSFKGCKVALD